MAPFESILSQALYPNGYYTASATRSRCDERRHPPTVARFMRFLCVGRTAKITLVGIDHAIAPSGVAELGSWRDGRRPQRSRLFHPHLVTLAMHHERADSVSARSIGEIDFVLDISTDDRCPTAVAQRTVCEARVGLATWSAWKGTSRETRPDLSVQSAIAHGRLPSHG